MKIKWSPEGGVTRKTHQEHIKNFAEVFHNSVKKLIDMNAKKANFLESYEKRDQILIQEILDHARFSIECVEKFHGRVDLINRVVLYFIIICC